MRRLFKRYAPQDYYMLNYLLQREERKEKKKDSQYIHNYIYYESYCYSIVLVVSCCCRSTSIFTLFSSMRALHSGQ